MAAYFTHLQRLLRAQSRSYSESIFLRIEASVLSDAIRSRRCQFALLPSLIRPAVALLPTPDRLSSVTMKSHCPGQLRSPRVIAFHVVPRSTCPTPKPAISPGGDLFLGSFRFSCKPALYPTRSGVVHFELQGMHERAARIGGTFTLV
jgi:hypothetical protein